MKYAEVICLSMAVVIISAHGHAYSSQQINRQDGPSHPVAVHGGYGGYGAGGYAGYGAGGLGRYGAGGYGRYGAGVHGGYGAGGFGRYGAGAAYFSQKILRHDGPAHPVSRHGYGGFVAGAYRGYGTGVYGGYGAGGYRGYGAVGYGGYGAGDYGLYGAGNYGGYGAGGYGGFRAGSFGGHAAGYGGHGTDYYAHPKYDFAYQVSDPHTGDHKSQHESRDGDVVKGHYSLQQPDGSQRDVHYYGDDQTGFHADVKHSIHHVAANRHHY